MPQSEWALARTACIDFSDLVFSCSLFIVVDNGVLKLVKEFRIHEVNLMTIYHQYGVLKSFNHKFVLFLILKLQIYLINELMIHPFQEEHAQKE